MVLAASVSGQTVKETHGTGQQSDDTADAETGEEEEEEKLSREAQKALFEAQEAMKEPENDYAAAVQLLVDYAANKPPEENIPTVWYHMLGYAYSAQDKMKEARQVFKDGHEADPDDENLLLNYAIATWEVEEFAEAAAVFEKIYETREEKDVKFLRQSAAAWYQAEELLEAKRVLKRMLSLPVKPEADWYQTLINICMEMEQMDEAEGYVWEFLKFDPLQAEYWQLLAQLRLDNDDYRSAASALEISYVIKEPKRKKSYEDLADLFAYLSAPLKAAASLENAYKDQKPSDKFMGLVDAYARAQRFSKALKYINQLIAEKRTGRLLLEKGNLLYNGGRIKEAIAAWDECIDVEPDKGECHILKGFAYWDLLDWENARSTFEVAMDNEEYELQAEDAIAVLDDLDAAKYDPDAPDHPK